MEKIPKMGNTPPRLGLKMGSRPDGDRMPRIPPDFGENPGQPTGIQNGPIFPSNLG